MKILDKLERVLGRFALPHLTLAVIMCQVVIYAMVWTKPEAIDRLLLIPDKVLAGEVWRLFSFLIVPPLSNPLFAFFFWYLFYLMGTSLENHWGTFWYNVYLLIGYVCSVAVSFVQPESPASNGFLYGSVFLAFAYLCPDFELLIMFLLPVKIKWIALVTWISYALMVAVGGLSQRLLVLASISNFALFFGKDLINRTRWGRKAGRYLESRAAAQARQGEPFHRCAVCGITDQTHRQMDFRYCSKCDGECCYCSDHLHHHEHILKGDAARN